MVTKKLATYVNLLLFVLAVGITAAHVSEIRGDRITGNFFETQQEPVCIFENGEQSSEIPLDRCCLEALEQAECVETNGKYTCSTVEERRYILNSQAYSQCQEVE